MRTLNQYIPSNLDIDRLLQDYPPTFNLDKDKLVHILNLLNEVPSYDHKQYENQDGWIPLHSVKIRQSGIRDFPKIKQWLIEAGIIETDDHYIVGEKSICYRFAPKYRTPVRIEQIKGRTLIRKITKESEQQISSKKTYADLYKWFPKLRIDVCGAEQYLWLKYHTDKIKILTGQSLSLIQD